MNVTVNDGSDAFSCSRNHGVAFSHTCRFVIFIVVVKCLGLAWQRNESNTLCLFQIRFITIDIVEQMLK